MPCGCGSRGRAGRAVRTSGDYAAEGYHEPPPAAQPLAPTPDGSVPENATHRVVADGQTLFFATYQEAYGWQADNGGMLHTV